MEWRADFRTIGLFAIITDIVRFVSMLFILPFCLVFVLTTTTVVSRINSISNRYDFAITASLRFVAYNSKDLDLSSTYLFGQR